MNFFVKLEIRDRFERSYHEASRSCLTDDELVEWLMHIAHIVGLETVQKLRDVCDRKLKP